MDDDDDGQQVGKFSQVFFMDAPILNKPTGERGRETNGRSERKEGAKRGGKQKRVGEKREKKEREKGKEKKMTKNKEKKQLV